MKLHEQVEERIHSVTENYTNTALWNVDERFSHNILSIFDAFLIFNLDNIPTDGTPSKFSVYGHSEAKVLSNHYFVYQNKNKNSFFEEYESFKRFVVNEKQMSQFYKKLVTSSTKIRIHGIGTYTNLFIYKQ